MQNEVSAYDRFFKTNIEEYSDPIHIFGYICR